MKYQWLGFVEAIAVVGGLPWVMVTTVVGQDDTADAWTVTRTPWGDPDLAGIWNSKNITPLERRDAYGDREFLTDDEVAAIEAQAEGRFSTALENTAGISLGGERAERGTVRDVYQAYSPLFLSLGTNWIRTKRTSLIIDPPDGKIPHTQEGLDKVAAERAYRAALRASDLLPVVDMAENPEDRPNDRCIGFVLPCTSFQCAFRRIVQSPSSVTFYYEGGHVGGAYRTVSLDGRPHIPSHIRQWYGDSVGHWEGDTLVIDTANFTSWKGGNLTTSPLGFNGNGEQFHLVERLTRVESDMILYRATVENPTLYSRPWTIEVPWIEADGKQNQIFESACHEGNYGLTGLLAGAREGEKEASR